MYCSLEIGKENKNQKIIAVALPKGGVGKTATAVNLAASLAVAEKNTLLIDFDPSAASSAYLGFLPDKITSGIFDIFSFTKSLTSVIQETPLKCLQIVPMNSNSYQQENRLARLTNNIQLFRNILRNESTLGYDYIIIDCPPYIGGLTSIALTSADSVLIPLKAGNLSVLALNKLIDHINWIRKNANGSLEIEGILPTMVEPLTRASMMTMEKIHQEFGNLVLDMYIPKSVSITESEFSGVPTILFDATSSGALAYLELAKELMFKHSRVFAEVANY